MPDPVVAEFDTTAVDRQLGIFLWNPAAAGISCLPEPTAMASAVRDRSELWVLSADDCYQLLATQQIGRLAAASRKTSDCPA
jgi:hypothetical protein